MPMHRSAIAETRVTLKKRMEVGPEASVFMINASLSINDVAVKHNTAFIWFSVANYRYSFKKDRNALSHFEQNGEIPPLRDLTVPSVGMTVGSGLAAAPVEMTVVVISSGGEAPTVISSEAAEGSVVEKSRHTASQRMPIGG